MWTKSWLAFLVFGHTLSWLNNIYWRWTALEKTVFWFVHLFVWICFVLFFHEKSKVQACVHKNFRSGVNWNYHGAFWFKILLHVPLMWKEENCSYSQYWDDTEMTPILLMQCQFSKYGAEFCSWLQDSVSSLLDVWVMLFPKAEDCWYCSILSCLPHVTDIKNKAFYYIRNIFQINTKRVMFC